VQRVPQAGEFGFTVGKVEAREEWGGLLRGGVLAQARQFLRRGRRGHGFAGRGLVGQREALVAVLEASEDLLDVT